MNTRRNFLKATIGLASVFAVGFTVRKKAPRLSFSTLGCPTWSLSQIMKTAVSEGYEAVEIRGLQGELFLPKRPEFSTGIGDTRAQFSDNNLKVCNLGSSAALHHADPATRKTNLDDAKRFIDLAQQLSCPYVRVFPNDLPKDQDRQQTLDLIAEGLMELGRYGKDANVTVLLESHGELVHTDLLLQIFQHAEHPNVGLIWDIFNMWSVTKEPPATTFGALRKYIRHTHIKDATMVAGKYAYTFVGKGEVPLKEAINALKSSGYSGYYSFEWEKMWHPEIPEPELAFADYPKAMQQYF